jgi:hypothetical protein
MRQKIVSASWLIERKPFQYVEQSKKLRKFTPLTYKANFVSNTDYYNKNVPVHNNFSHM